MSELGLCCIPSHVVFSESAAAVATAALAAATTAVAAAAAVWFSPIPENSLASSVFLLPWLLYKHVYPTGFLISVLTFLLVDPIFVWYPFLTLFCYLCI